MCFEALALVSFKKIKRKKSFLCFAFQICNVQLTKLSPWSKPSERRPREAPCQGLSQRTASSPMLTATRAVIVLCQQLPKAVLGDEPSHQLLLPSLDGGAAGRTIQRCPSCLP